MMYYVYILKSKLYNQIYIGSAIDLKKRFTEHNAGRVISTKRYKPWSLSYYEAYMSEKLARVREQRLKHNGNALRELKKRIGLANEEKQGSPSSVFVPKSGAGFTLVELLVVAAIFVTAVGAFFGAAQIAFRVVAKASDKVQAAFLLEEGLEGVRYMRDLSWKKYIDKEQLGYEQCFYFNSTDNLFATSTPEIVSQWHLDEAAGATGMAITDTSSKNNNGTFIFDGTGGMVASGKYQNAANFDGAGDYITTSKLASTDLNLNSGTGVSYEAWVYPTAYASNREILSHQCESTCGALYVSNSAGFDIIPSFDQLRFQFPANSGGFNIITLNISLTNNLPLNSWAHLVGTWDFSAKKINVYVNGVSKGSLDVNPAYMPAFLSKSFTIGAGRSDTGYVSYFQGKIDEVAIYNRAFSASEVLDRYNGHAICPLVTATDDNSKTFTRTVKFENVCRHSTSSDIVGTTVSTCSGSTLDTGTKKATVYIIWGAPDKRDFVEKVEMYIANLFLN